MDRVCFSTKCIFFRTFCFIDLFFKLWTVNIYSKWLKRQFCFKICCIISVLQSSDDDWDTEESSRSGEMTFMWECEVNKSKLWILFCLNLRHFFSWITVMNFVSIFPEVCFTNKKPLFVFALSLFVLGFSIFVSFFAMFYSFTVTYIHRWRHCKQNLDFTK